jgi:uncharacterized protein YbaR (Trm112 family)
MKNYGEANEIKYTPKELKYRLFGKKLCPLCKSKMVVQREKVYSHQERTRIGLSRSSIALTKPIDVYRIIEHYYCEQCDRKYTISELAEGGQSK